MMSERLIKREEQRRADLERKRKEKQLNKNEAEDPDYIMSQLNKGKNDIESKFNSIQQNGGDNLDFQGVISDAIERYDELKQFINESSAYLPAYHQRVVQEAFKSLKTLIENNKRSLIPNAKISFDSNVIKSDQIKDEECFDGMKTCVNANELSFCGLKNISNSPTPLMILPNEVNQKDLQLDNISGCKIEIYGGPNTIHISNLTNCKVYSGPASTSIFIQNCHDCIFQLACQQLRIHTSKNCHFYLHVTSRSIIEDSNHIRFAPYDWSYDQLNDHFELAKLNQKVNNWNKIDDFNWLSSEPSPNWSFINQ